MSEIHEEPSESELSYPDAREDQSELQGLIEEKEGDYQEAVDAQQEGEEPEDPRPNPSMP